jgi:L-fuculose-phosphate aldolase
MISAIHRQSREERVVAQRNAHTENELRRELVRVGKWLSRLGFMPGTSGNLSVRLDQDRVLATPTGISKNLLRCADVVVVDLGDRQLAGSRKVTSEVGMHLAIYMRRRDVNAVIHSHPPIATAFACAGRPLDEMLCQEAVMTLGPVPLARYATTGTNEVADSLSSLIPGYEAILMSNHGAVTYGDNLTDAFHKMETLEHLAHIRVVAHQLGGVRTLEEKQAHLLLCARETYKQNIAS